MLTYIIIAVVGVLVLGLCFALSVANFSFQNFQEKFEQLDKKHNTAGLTTAEYVERLNQNNFGGRLRMGTCQTFCDNYCAGVISLSEQTMRSNSLASLSIVSHEMGHARQDFSGDTLKKHATMLKAGRICGLFFMPLLLAGVILLILAVFNVFDVMLLSIIGGICLLASAIIFIFAVILKYKEIKIEKEASLFAVEFLREFLTEPEVSLCEEFLKSAFLTYWAQLFRALLSWTMLTNKTKMFR